MFFNIESSLDALASVIPAEADKIDQIKSSLREILASAVSGGAPFASNEQRQIQGGGSEEPPVM